MAYSGGDCCGAATISRVVRRRFFTGQGADRLPTFDLIHNSAVAGLHPIDNLLSHFLCLRFGGVSVILPCSSCTLYAGLLDYKVIERKNLD